LAGHGRMIVPSYHQSNPLSRLFNPIEAAGA
jgi:hypothetical protein